MFQQQARGNGPPGMPGQPPQVQQPSALIQCQSDLQAKEKLTTLIYEYLTLTGAPKTAEAFKEEVLNANPSFANFKPAEKGPSFLLDWWTIFWDLYCAAPERRDMGEGAYTQEAKYFHDNVIGPMQPPVMNGHFGHPMGLGGPDMMGAHGFGRFPGRIPPGPMPPGGFGMFPDPRMARIPGNQMRMPPGASFPGAPPPGSMRPGQPPQMPGMPRYNDFMGGPPGSAFPSGSGMMPNGAGIPPMSMSSPGMPPPPGSAEAIAAGQPPFMGMPGASSASSMPPFGMDPIATSTASATAPGSVPPGSVPPVASSSNDTPPTTTSAATPGGTVIGGPSSAGPSSSGGCGGGGGAATTNGSIPSVGAPTSLINGDDIKTSPVTTPHGGNGNMAGSGTPAPGSAQSVGAMQPGTPSGGPPSHPPLSAGAPIADFKDDSEISKIKEGLLDGFMKTEGSEASFYT